MYGAPKSLPEIVGLRCRLPQYEPGEPAGRTFRFKEETLSGEETAELPAATGFLIFLVC